MPDIKQPPAEPYGGQPFVQPQPPPPQVQPQPQPPQPKYQPRMQPQPQPQPQMAPAQPPQQYQQPQQYQPQPQQQFQPQPQQQQQRPFQPMQQQPQPQPQFQPQQQSPSLQSQPQSLEPATKPQVKEVTITLSGKLPTVPAPATEPHQAPQDVRRILEDGSARQVTTVTRQTIEHRESQQRILEIRPPEKAPPPAVQPRPTQLPLQQPERPSSRAAGRAQGSWCAKTGRFVPDPGVQRPEIVKPPPPPPAATTPGPRRPPGGSYCPRTGRYIPAHELERNAMTPKGDEFRVKFADQDPEEPETPRYLRKARTPSKPNLVFGSVWTPREEKRTRVRRAKSSDWLEQRNAITPRGDGRDRDFAKSVENFNSNDDPRPVSRLSSGPRSGSWRAHPEGQPHSDLSHVTPRVSTFNDHYQPSGGHKKVVAGSKLQWSAKSKVDSFAKRDEKPTAANTGVSGLDKKLQEFRMERDGRRHDGPGGQAQVTARPESRMQL